MRPTSSLLAILSCGLLAGCASHAAYGLSSDERLETSTNEKGSAEGADVATLKCNDMGVKMREAKSDEKPEGERLTAMTEIFSAAKDHATKLDDAVAKNPDLLYRTEGESIKANLEECRSAYADIRSELDRYVREIAELPVIQEVQGNKTVNVPRLDFALVRAAIVALDPDDKDVLNGKIDNAEKKVARSKKEKEGNGK